jgi:hypothetical protein
MLIYGLIVSSLSGLPFQENVEETGDVLGDLAGVFAGKRPGGPRLPDIKCPVDEGLFLTFHCAQPINTKASERLARRKFPSEATSALSGTEFSLNGAEPSALND